MLIVSTYAASPRRIFPRWLPFLASGVVLCANRRITSSTPLLRRAVLDEAAHLATTALALEATGRREPPYLVSALAAAVLIDIDHVPYTIFGWAGLTAKAPRPYTHSLATIAAVPIISRLVSPARGPLLDGLVFGLATHLLRDVSDGSAGAPLLWPLARSGVKLPAGLQGPVIVATLIRISCGSRAVAEPCAQRRW